MDRFKALFLIGLLLGAGVVVASNSFNSGDAVQISDGVPVASPNGLTVTMYGNTNVSMDDLFQGTNDRLVVVNMSEGNITLGSDNTVSAAIYNTNITGTYTNVSQIDTGSNWLEIYPEGKQRVDTKGDVNALSIKSMALSDGNTDFWYSGTDGGTVTVKVYDLPNNTRIAAIDESDTFMDVNRSTSTGNVTLHLDASSHTITLTDKNATAAPTQSNPDPTGLISNSPSELSIDINDSDFPGDEVNVSIYLDGSEIHQENITSNGTVTTSNFGTLDLGEHTWAVNATDYYGNVNNQTYDFRLPSNITLRNETNASQVIKNQNITATFYSENGSTILQRSDSNGDGNISLRGLPDTSFVVTFRGDGWHDRRAFIESIGNQQNIYLLNSTAYTLENNTAIQTTFVYEDRTGQFEQKNTTLRIQRAVDPDGDGNFQWQTVAGDFWGAAGEFPFTGEYQARYRLVIKNQQTDDKRILGTHIPTSDGVKNIIVGRIIFEAENATGRWFDARVNASQDRVEAVYKDPTNSTTDLRIKVMERNNHSNVIYNQVHSGPFGRKAVTVGLTQNQTEKDWVVVFDGTHAEDGNVGGEIIAGGSGEYGLPIDPAILYSFAYLVITFVMSLYGPRTALFGAWAGVLLAGGFMFLGWVNISIVTYTVSLLIVIGATFYKEAMP